MDKYNELISQIPIPLHNESAVLYCVVLTTVSQSESITIDDSIASDESDWLYGKLYQPISIGRGITPTACLNITNVPNDRCLPTYSSILTSDFSLIPNNLLNNNTITIYNDDNMHKNICLVISDVVNKSIDSIDLRKESIPTATGIYNFTKQALIRRFYQLTLALNYQPTTQQVNQTVNEDSIDLNNEIELNHIPIYLTESIKQFNIRETELLYYSVLSRSDFIRYRHLLNLNNMLQLYIKRLPNYTNQTIDYNTNCNITSRRYYQDISSLTFQQLYNEELLKLPNVVKKYDKWTDSLYIVMYWDNPIRRMLKYDWETSISTPITKVITPVVNNDISDDITNSSLDVKPDIEKPASKPKASKNDSKTNKSTNKSKSANKSNKNELLINENNEPLVESPTNNTPSPMNTITNLTTTYKHKTILLTPVGKLLLFVNSHQSNSLLSNNWLTIRSCNNLVFGLRNDNTNNPVFYLNTFDNVRYTVISNESTSSLNTKPDGNGTMILNTLLPNGLNILTVSNGLIQISCLDVGILNPTIHSNQLTNKAAISSSMIETNRYIHNNGTITRFFQSNCPFTKEILYSNGIKILYRNTHYVIDKSKYNLVDKPKSRLSSRASSISSLVSNNTNSHINSKNFYDILIYESSMESWDYIYLSVNGDVVYYNTADSLSSKHITINSNIVSDVIDGQTNDRLVRYLDGMIITYHTVNNKPNSNPKTNQSNESINQITTIYFNDLTKVITSDVITYNDIDRVNEVYKVLYIEKTNLPSIEIDSQIDNTAKKHSLGESVPINKGGDQTRIRLLHPDGTAVQIKYDTRITSITNGSIKLTRYDKTRLLIRDNSHISVYLPTEWRKQNEVEFHNENVEPKPVSVKIDSKINKNESKGDLLYDTKAINDDILINMEIIDTKIDIYLNKLQCTVEDNEYNIFKIDLLNDPMNPSVTLSGEVEGLKPKAVSGNPIDPRVFILNRNGIVTEIVSDKEISELEILSNNNPNTSRYITRIDSQPNDLGSIKQHSYITAYQYNKFTFDKIFGLRSYLTVDICASASYELNNRSEKSPNHMNKSMYKRPSFSSNTNINIINKSAKINFSSVLYQQLPLSQEGYRKLEEDINRWEAFSNDRINSIDRFHVDTTRNDNNIELENLIAKRLKKAYKLNKKLKKGKEKDQNQMLLQQQQELVNILGTEIYQPGAKLEDVDELDESIQEFSSDSEDDEEDIDVEDIEINSAFNEYAVNPAPIQSSSSYNLNMSMSSMPSPNNKTNFHINIPMSNNISNDPPYLLRDQIRLALIQILNRSIDKDMIEQELIHLGLDQSQSIYLAEFKALYQRIKYLLNPNIQEYSLNIITNNISTNDTADLIDSPIIHSNKSLYWKSELGMQSESSIDPSLPPLDQRPWDFNVNDDIRGATVQVIRNIKNK